MNQPRFLKSLNEQPRQDFYWPNGRHVAAGVGVSPDDAALIVGVRDAPERQEQVLEQIMALEGSILIEGVGGSGRTSALRTLLMQAQTMVAAYVVVDPVADNSSHWRELVSGPGCWLILGTVKARLQHALRQLDRVISSSGGEGQRTLVVLERLDSVAATWGDSEINEFCQLVINGPRKGVMVIASSDIRVPLDMRLRRAFRHHYGFQGEIPHLLRGDSGQIVRPLEVPPSEIVAHHVARPLAPLGILDREEVVAALVRARTETPGALYYAIDEETHTPLALREQVHLCVTGGFDSNQRVGTVLDIARQAYEFYGTRIMGLVPPDHRTPEWMIDLLGEPRVQPGEGTLVDRVRALLSEYCENGPRIIFVLEAHLLERTVRRRFGSTTHWAELLPVATQHCDMAAVLSVRTPPRSNDYRGEFSLDNADYVWVQPPLADIVNSVHSHLAAVRLLAGTHGKNYEADQGTASIDQQRHEVKLVITAETSASRGEGGPVGLEAAN